MPEQAPSAAEETSQEAAEVSKLIASLGQHFSRFAASMKLAHTRSPQNLRCVRGKSSLGCGVRNACVLCQEDASNADAADAQEEGEQPAQQAKGRGANLVSTVRSFLPFVSKAAEAPAQPAAGKKPVKVRFQAARICIEKVSNSCHSWQASILLACASYSRFARLYTSAQPRSRAVH